MLKDIRVIGAIVLAVGHVRKLGGAEEGNRGNRKSPDFRCPESMDVFSKPRFHLELTLYISALCTKGSSLRESAPG